MDNAEHDHPTWCTLTLMTTGPDDWCDLDDHYHAIFGQHPDRDLARVNLVARPATTSYEQDRGRD